MYYLYRHIRLDKNEPFYIGIGKKSALPKVYKYQRSHDKINRNKFWKRIVAKTAYEIEILYESESFDIIASKEIEFIKLYGRRDLRLGTLCNLNNGGGYTNRGYKKTKETIEKHRKSLIGIKQDSEWIRKAKEGKYIPVNCYSLKDVLLKSYISAKSTKLDGFDPPTVTNCCKGKRETHHNKIWKYA
jgi:hypothetical protein